MRIIRGMAAVMLVTAFLVTDASLRSVVSQSTNASSDLNGFTRDGSAAQRRWEEDFRSVPAPGSAREHLRKLTAEPHVAGTKEDYATAIYVRDQIRSYGIPSALKEYSVAAVSKTTGHRGADKACSRTARSKGGGCP